LCTFAAAIRRDLNAFLFYSLKRKDRIIMIIVPVKEGENIDRALKKLKRKFDKTGTLKELRSRKNYAKKSVVNREKMLKAIYVQQLRQNSEI